MNRDSVTNNLSESKYESRTVLDNYYSVQFTLSRMDPAYLFKLRNISDNGLCILVKQDSSAFKKLKVGDVVDMEYNPKDLSSPTKLLKTQITSKNCFDCFKNHSLVELTIIDN